MEWLVLGLVLLVMPLAGTLIGAFCGLVVGVFFSNAILDVLAQAGVQGVAVWEVGAFLGFVSGFFRSRVSSKE